MTTEWLITLRDAGSAVYDVFRLPGEFLMLQFATRAPAVALQLGIDGNSDVVPLSAALSVLIWLLLIGVVLKFLRFLQNLLRRLMAGCRNSVFRASLRIRSFKTELLSKLPKMLRRRLSNSVESNPELVIEDIDLAVLRNTAAAGGSCVVAAPGLAEQLTLRPAQAQRSLDRLREYGMVEVVLGSTDGFDNYRLSLAGAAFLAALQRSGTGVRKEDALSASPAS